MRIVVEGCGDWALQYFRALKAYANPDVGVIFTYDSTFGLDVNSWRQPAHLYMQYLNNTLRNVQEIENARFACIDTKDTLFRQSGKPNECRKALPDTVDAVFVATPDRTHCDVATYWLNRSRHIFVEKPFDISSERVGEFIEQMSGSASNVYAIDHYFVRCNQAAADAEYFLQPLLGGPGGALRSFRFHMTEPPEALRKGEIGSMQKRVLSVQSGMIMDMGSHALPVLMPFIDMEKPVSPTAVWAGISQRLSNIMYEGGETFSVAELQCFPDPLIAASDDPITGTFFVGKDIGDRAEKFLELQGDGGTVRFDLVNYTVHHQSPDGVRYIAPLQESWARMFVGEVLDNRLPKAVERFRPDGARDVVKFLEAWRRACHISAPGSPSALTVHAPGLTLSALKTDEYLRPGVQNE